ncbi:MAG: hypothetical protein CM1200mP28_07550 [Deltaproteobacteria bacterium]|nr:MAG: hypothetical protein CM1200mP28_07550 [Deltaproteobacteria bacterium]
MPEVSDEALIPVEITGSMPEFELPDNLVSLEANVLKLIYRVTTTFQAKLL